MIGFGRFGMLAQAQAEAQAQAQAITTLTDDRLAKIDPRAEGFFDAVINVKTSDLRIKLFIKAIEEVKAANLEAFYKPIYDPSEGLGEIPIIYQKGNKPAVGHSYEWWIEAASKMPTVEGKSWDVASEYHWYALLVDIINKKVTSGDKDALIEVVNNSTTWGHYYNSEDSTEGENFEPTGSRCVCGFYDLVNTYKILKCSNKKAGGFWRAGGDYSDGGYRRPLANLEHDTAVNRDDNYGVAMLVL